MPYMHTYFLPFQVPSHSPDAVDVGPEELKDGVEEALINLWGQRLKEAVGEPYDTEEVSFE